MGGADVMRKMLGGAPALGSTTHRSLELRLQSPQVVENPIAEHRIPAGLAMGATLPLKSTSLEKADPPSWSDEDLVQGKGQLLLFRGCSESAGANQPEIVMMQGWTEEQKRQALAGLKALLEAWMRPAPRAAGPKQPTRRRCRCRVRWWEATRW